MAVVVEETELAAEITVEERARSLPLDDWD